MLIVSVLAHKFLCHVHLCGFCELVLVKGDILKIVLHREAGGPDMPITWTYLMALSAKHMCRKTSVTIC